MQKTTKTLALARANGRSIGSFTSGYVVCRPTQQAAVDYEHYVADENGDWAAIDHLLDLNGSNIRAVRDLTPEGIARRRRAFAVGHGGCPLVGDPDDVAAGLARLHEAGFAGFAFSFVNYNAEFPYFRDEVLPRLERLGLRKPPASRGAD